MDEQIAFIKEMKALPDLASRAATPRGVLLALKGARSVTAVLTAHKPAARPQGHSHAPRPTAGAPERQGPTGVKAVIAVASGKGGVGKSTVAVNLAVALHQLGRKVGLLDADIYGPSIPRMLGLKGKPTSKDGKILQPMQAWGLKAILTRAAICPCPNTVFPFSSFPESTPGNWILTLLSSRVFP